MDRRIQCSPSKALKSIRKRDSHGGTVGIRATAHWNWEGRCFFYLRIDTSVTFFSLGLHWTPLIFQQLLRNWAPWWLWTELQKRLRKCYSNFWMLTALESSNSSTEPIHSKQCFAGKKGSDLRKKKWHSCRNPIIDFFKSSELVLLTGSHVDTPWSVEKHKSI